MCFKEDLRQNRLEVEADRLSHQTDIKGSSKVPTIEPEDEK